MPYTQSALQTELSRQREAAAGWPWRLMTLSIIVLLAVVAVYLGMRFGFEEAYLKGALADEEATYAATFKSVSPEDQKRVFDFYSQLSNIDTLLKKQGKVTPYAVIIEQNTLNAITFSNLDIKTSDTAIVAVIVGRTATYSSIVQQLGLFKAAPDVSDVKLLGARFVNPTDGINFSIQITFDR